jgi:hypothetical protein
MSQRFLDRFSRMIQLRRDLPLTQKEHVEFPDVAIESGPLQAVREQVLRRFGPAEILPHRLASENNVAYFTQTR